MADEVADEQEQQNPWARPGFAVAAVLVAVIVVLGIVIAVITATRDHDQHPGATGPTGQASPAQSGGPSAAPGGASVCGLPGVKMSGALPTPPAAKWAYQGTTAYPNSAQFGPRKTDPAGFRYCFQHSPEGALFAAANAVVQGSDHTVSGAWLQYFVAPGQYHDRLANDRKPPSTSSGSRMSIEGYRLLAYNGRKARVDLAIRATSGPQIGTVSAVYELVWQGGDWKLSSDVAEPVNVARVPDLAGYISWKA